MDRRALGPILSAVLALVAMSPAHAQDALEEEVLVRDENGLGHARAVGHVYLLCLARRDQLAKF